MSDQCKNCTLREGDPGLCNSIKFPCDVPTSWYVKQLIDVIRAMEAKIDSLEAEVLHQKSIHRRTLDHISQITTELRGMIRHDQ